MNTIYGSDGEHDRFIAGRGYEDLNADAPFLFTTTHLKLETWNESRPMKLMKINTRVNKLNVYSGLMRVAQAVESDEEPPSKNCYYIASHLLDGYGGSKDRYHLVEQLTSEVYKLVKGKKRKSWVRVKRQNHFFDCLSQAEALATMDNVEFIKTAPQRAETANVEKIVNELKGFIG
jgi:phage terminase large subunit GpA-like protein